MVTPGRAWLHVKGVCRRKTNLYHEVEQKRQRGQRQTRPPIQTLCKRFIVKLGPAFRNYNRIFDWNLILTQYFWYIWNYQNWPCFFSFVKFWSTKLHKNVSFKAKNICCKAKNVHLNVNNVWFKAKNVHFKAKNIHCKAKNIFWIFSLSFAKILQLQNFRLVLIVLINSKLAVFGILWNTKLQNCLPFAGLYCLEEVLKYNHPY